MNVAIGSRRVGIMARAASLLAVGVLAVVLAAGCGDDGDNGESNPSSTAYKVTFNANGGSGTAPAAITADAGSSVTLPSQGNLTRSGYEFGGWNTNSSGTGTNYDAGSSYTPTGGVTLYAKWNAASSATTFVDSRDNKTYKKVTIGTQTWMAENLDYNATGSKCYKDSTAYCDTYGRLYEYSKAMDGASSSAKVPSGVQGVCPADWHLPSTYEWDILVAYAGGDSLAGRKLKSTSGWDKNGNGIDAYGFSALPGSGFSIISGYIGIGSRGAWWSATERSVNDSMAFGLHILSAPVTVGGTEASGIADRKNTAMYSVRCVQDYEDRKPTTVYKVTYHANDGNGGVVPVAVIVDSGSSVTLPGGVVTRSGFDFGGWNTNWSGKGTNYDAGSTYKPDSSITLYAKWNNGSDGGEGYKGEYGTLTHGGQTYKTVVIGTQTWMAENLNYDIPNVTTDVCYGNSADSCGKYGKLYTWNDAMKACPSGWRVPSNDEWGIMADYVGGYKNAGTVLTSTTGWKKSSDVPAGTDEYGFSALPGGSGNSDGNFEYVGERGVWWSSTENERAATDAFRRYIYWYETSLGGAGISAYKTDLFSVRCLQD